MGTKMFDGLRWRKTLLMIAFIGLVLFQSAWSVSARPQDISNFVVQCHSADGVCDPEETFQAPLNVTYDNLTISANYTGSPENVSLEVISSDITVLPQGNVTIIKNADMGGVITYTVAMTPTKTGTTDLNVIFSDGQQTINNKYYYTVTNNYIYLPLVLKPSAPPVLEGGYSQEPFTTNVSIYLDESPIQISAFMSDVDSPRAGWTVTVTSSNQNVIPNANITVTPGPNNGTPTLLPFYIDATPTNAGTTTLTVVASDGEGSSSTYYVQVTVIQNSEPVISGLPTTLQTLKLNKPTKFTFTATDADGDYPLTFRCNGEKFDPTYGSLDVDCVFAGSGPSYTVTVTVREVTDQANLYLVVTDSVGRNDFGSFKVKVIP